MKKRYLVSIEVVADDMPDVTARVNLGVPLRERRAANEEGTDHPWREE